MTDVFISHAQSDLPLAEYQHRHLSQEGLSVYLASVAMRPGKRWQQSILDNLRSLTWVICLASKAACESPWVMQEMGVAVGTNMKLVPIVWDVTPNSLPGWMQQYQAVNLGGASQEEAKAEIVRIFDAIKSDKQKGLAILGLTIAGLMLFGK